MPTYRQIFRILRAASDPTADAALLAALEHADPETAEAIVTTVLQRRCRPGLYGLVARLHLLDDAIRLSLEGEIDALFGVLREAAQSRDEQVRLNALEMIRRCRAYRACYLLESAFHDSSSRIREAAGDTLHFLAEEILRGTPPAPDPASLLSLSGDEVQARMAALDVYLEDRRQFVAAIEAGLNLFEVHRQNRVVEVAMWFVDDLGSKFWPVVSAPNSRVGRAVLRILQDGLTPRLVPCAMAALSYGQFRPYVAPALGQCDDSDVLAEWVRQSWRLLQPKAARAMTAVKELACTERRAAELLRLPDDAQRHLGRWVLATGLPPECKVDVLAEVLHRAERPGQRSAVCAALEWIEEPSIPLLRDISTGSDAEFARVARYELARRRPTDYPIFDVLARATSPAPTEQVGSSPGAQFDRYWTGFDRLNEADRTRVGRELIARTPTFPLLLARKLTDAEPAVRLRALNIIRVLNYADPFAPQLHQMAHDPDSEVRSAVMTVLAQVPGGTSRRILHAALSDQDARVRANAVEAVEQTGDEDVVNVLMPLLGSADNRVRANAVSALLKQGIRPAAENLLKMLDDQDRDQRISALWIVERMDLFALAAKTARMAACDDDPQVRLRAQKIVERMRREFAVSIQDMGAGKTPAAEVIAP